jgi:predicted  nucleic acid-binding Zn-ribbon protein
MEEAEGLSRDLKEAEAELKRQHAEVAAERKVLSEEATALEQAIGQHSSERGQVAGELSPAALALFEHVAKARRGLAVAEARDGLCTVCHVRLRPQVFNEVRRNDALIQCDSCQRILYFVPAATSEAS